MKKTIIIAALIFCAFISQRAYSQVSINIGIQPIWGPVGYEHVDYYYLPDVDAYYDVPSHMYVYMDGGVWVHRGALPGRYANYDLYHGYKAVVNVHDPWLHHDVYRNQYASYRGHHDQVVIRDSREPRYYENSNHPMHGQYHPEHHDNGVPHDNRGERHENKGEHHDNGEHRGGGHEGHH
jgi:hypothetical protein